MYQTKLYKKKAIISSQIENWKEDGEKIVFTNGCFDLIHIGHVSYLQEAKALGDRLVIGINSDKSVSQLKGSSRPIKDETNRMAIIASLESVDMVILFEEETPIKLINMIEPDVLVKGGDWDISQIVGAEDVISKGGMVKSLNFIDGYSSTKLIDKIKSE